MTSFTDYELVYFIILRWEARLWILVNYYYYRIFVWMPLNLLWKSLMFILSVKWGVKSNILTEEFLRIFLRIIAKLLGQMLEKVKKKKGMMWLFWMCYFHFADPTEFIHNYTAAWKQKCPSWSISMFLDNGKQQEVPCEKD